MSSSIEYFSSILSTTPQVLEDLVWVLDAKTGKSGVLDALQETNEQKMREVLSRLGIADAASGTAIARALAAHVRESESSLLGSLKSATSGTSPPELETLYATFCNSAAALSGNRRGFFLKVIKAREMLEHYPPPNILQYFGYKDTAELLLKENLLEVWSALRFVETREWMNNVFLDAYSVLTPDDFEERAIRLFVLPKKWLDAAAAYVKKKYHNVSHLKEMGVIFIEPITEDAPGVSLRIFLLLLHYLHEVPFYSALFKRASGPHFARKLISYIRGDVSDYDGAEATNRVPIIQRYLAKENPGDQRLFTAHVNPEAIHWRRAENDIARFAAHMRGSPLALWHDLDWVGGHFGTDLAVFNLVDAVMSMIPERSADGAASVEIKYRYHHREALWNKIFFEYLGEETVEHEIVENLERGYLEI